jgi:hypothetical protein
MEWLDMALECGISEQEFWDSTLAEIERRLSSIKKIQDRNNKEKAYFIYSLSNLITISMARLYSKEATMPTLEECFPEFFNSEEIVQEKEEQQANISAIRFRMFADSFNKRYREGTN